jgi:hypothetical protein
VVSESGISITVDVGDTTSGFAANDGEPFIVPFQCFV